MSSDYCERKTIEQYINNELIEEDKDIALEFVTYLREKDLTFYKDNCECWRDKIYYWIKSGEECVCFIAIKDPEEKDNHWTVWSADMGSEWLESYEVDKEIKEHAWKSVDHCGHCGSCGGGRTKVIFGKEFNDVCGCTFRINNPDRLDLEVLKRIVDIRMKEIQNKYE